MKTYDVSEATSLEEKDNRKVLPDGQPIWLMTNDLSLKDHVERGLNREVVMIDSITRLVDESTLIRTSDGNRAYASLLFPVDNIPAEIRNNLEMVVSAIDNLTEVNVFELDVKPDSVAVFKTTEPEHRFGDIDSFIIYAKNTLISQEINNMDPTQKETQILKSLQVEIESKKTQVKQLEQQLQESTDAKDKADYAKANMEQQLAQMEADRKKDKSYADDLQKNLENVKRNLDISERKAKKYLEDKDTLFEEKEDLAGQVEGYEGALLDKDNDNKELKLQIDELKDEIKNLVREKNEIINSRVDSEVLVNMQHTVAVKDAELNKLKVQIKEKERDNNRLDVHLKALNNEVDEIKRNDNAIEHVGHSLLIGETNFKRIPLVYIKIFDRLPFHRKAINMLYNKFVAKFGYNTPHLIILKQDEDFDKHIFVNIPLVSKLADIRVDMPIVRMFPNRLQGDGINGFEQDTDFVMIVDYFQNDKYYYDTQGTKLFMNVLQKSIEIDDYHLKGVPISYDPDSWYDIKYNDQIVKSPVADIRYQLQDIKVENWFNRINQTTKF